MKITIITLLIILTASLIELALERKALADDKEHQKQLKCAYNAGKARMPLDRFDDNNLCTITIKE